MEKGLTKNEIVRSLAHSTHGNLKAYVPIAQAAAKEDPEFLAHLIAWNNEKGQIRDSKIAIPVASLTVARHMFDGELAENSYAHLAQLDPRSFLKAMEFAREMRVEGREPAMRKFVAMYLHAREGVYPLWERACIQHRASMKTLYARWHVKPSAMANNVLFKGKYVPGSLFDIVSKLNTMPVKEAAGYILTKKIPFLVVVGAMGSKLKDPDLALALIEQMSPAEIVTNAKMLEKLGVKTNPVLRVAYEQALQRVAEAKKGVSTFKTQRAAKALAEAGDTAGAAKLQAVQEKQIDKLKSIDGTWDVIADKSGSMHQAIETAMWIAATLSRLVAGKVYLIFVDNTPRGYDVTGKTLEEIQQLCRHVRAGGGTNLGCGLAVLREKGVVVDGIAVVSDGGENDGSFAREYAAYSAMAGKEVPVYMYELDGDSNRLKDNMHRAQYDMQIFNLRGQKIDYYALPNLVATMRTQRYGLVEEVMETPLLSLKEVFEKYQNVPHGEKGLKHAA